MEISRRDYFIGVALNACINIADAKETTKHVVATAINIADEVIEQTSEERNEDTQI